MFSCVKDSLKDQAKSTSKVNLDTASWYTPAFSRKVSTWQIVKTILAN